MGLFTKRTRTHDAAANNGNALRREKRSRGGANNRPLFDMESGDFNRRPSFGQW